VGHGGPRNLRDRRKPDIIDGNAPCEASVMLEIEISGLVIIIRRSFATEERGRI
jgi:hypothetical protein